MAPETTDCQLPESSSASRITAGAFGFLTLSQCVLGQDLRDNPTEQITERTQEAVTNYFNWFQNTMSAASPWTNTELNKKLLSYAIESVTAASAFMQQLSGAKNLEDAIRIQTEFMKTQMECFNQRAKELGEIYTNLVTAATKTPSGMST